MDFYIQASNPTHLDKPEFIVDDTLLGAIESVFPYETEDAILFWAGVYVPLRYKDVLSCIVSDVFWISKELRQRKSGTHTIVWGSQEFQCDWEFSWANGITEITFIRRGCIGLDELAHRSPVKIEIEQFIAEWEMPFLICRRALLACGYHTSNLIVMKELDLFLNSIAGRGYLYSDVTIKPT